MSLMEYIRRSGSLVSLETVSNMLKKGEMIDEKNFKELIDLNNLELIRLILQNGFVITSNMLLLLARKNPRMLLVCLNERENLPFTPNVVHMIALRQPSDILVKVVQAIARGHPSREMVEEYIKILIQLPTLDAFSAFVQELNIDMDDFLEDVQETTPKPISGKKYERSQRGVTRMKRLLGRTPDTIEVDKTDWMLEHNELCFCWDISIGEHKELYIPVTRYGESAGVGYYGSTNYNDPMFTWYYVEPDSDFVLKTNRAFVARNKIQAFMMLYNIDKTEFQEHNEQVIYSLYSNLREAGIYYDDTKHRSRLLSSTEVSIDNDSFTEGVTSFFRDWTDGIIYFEGGKMDFLDETLSDMLIKFGYDVLVLTHQPGNYGRLVSECLDVRKRSVSFSNIYEIKDKNT
jgi:hypothetical protein